MEQELTKEEWQARAIRYATALVDYMAGEKDHDIQANTGLLDADCERIAEVRKEAVALVSAHNAELRPTGAITPRHVEP